MDLHDVDYVLSTTRAVRKRLDIDRPVEPQPADGESQAGFSGNILPAVWSFALALRSRGLGSAWTTLHLAHECEVAELLGIPEKVTQVALLPVAYTKGLDFKPAARQPVEQVTSWNRYGQNEFPG